jgi:hypothetical protein
MNTKHKPGPWTEETDYVSAERKQKSGTSTIRDARGRFICTAPADKGRLIAAAPDLLAALETAACPCWVHNAAITDDIEALRKIALWYADWNNGPRLSAIAIAKATEA